MEHQGKLPNLIVLAKYNLNLGPKILSTADLSCEDLLNLIRTKRPTSKGNKHDRSGERWQINNETNNMV